MLEQRRLRIAIVALEETTASTVYGLQDLFASVGRDWGWILEGRPGERLAECFIASSTARGFAAPNGGWIRPHGTFADAGRPDLVLVPDLALAPGDRPGRSAGAATRFLRRCYARGATVASACSGAVLLGEAGLLDGAEATTHWAFGDALQAAHPTARIHPARVVVSSGEGGRLVTAGGGFSWLDLGLFLVARFFGEEEAMRQARLHLIDWHGKGQLPYAVLSRASQVDDRFVADCQRWLADHYRDRAPIAALAARVDVSDRSLTRRFSRATGMTPIEYVQTLRLEEAKTLLETRDDPVEAVALDVGYDDARFFRKLFRRRVGLSPSEYRRRFATLRRALRTA